MEDFVTKKNYGLGKTYSTMDEAFKSAKYAEPIEFYSTSTGNIIEFLMLVTIKIDNLILRIRKAYVELSGR
jgi:predicted membrane protein